MSDWTRCHEQACIRECEEGCCQGMGDTLEALREWCERGQYLPSSLNDWQQGFLTARREVRAILEGRQQ